MHPNERFVPPKQPSSARTLMVVIVIVIIVIGSSVGYLGYTQIAHTSATTTVNVCDSCVGQQVPADLLANLTGVSSSTLSTIGKQPTSSVAAPSSITGSALTSNGKPEILYIGAEYCPFCAMERWPLIIALSKFGTFSNLTLMLSSPTDTAGENIATFSFVNSTYSSPYISFVPIEFEDRFGNPLQTIPPADSSIQSTYDSGGSIPFVDLGNSYKIVGAQVINTNLMRVGGSASGAPLNWTQVASVLNDPNNALAKAIGGAANTLITAICKLTGGNPSSVCTESYANLSLALYFGQSSPIVSVAIPSKLKVT